MLALDGVTFDYPGPVRALDGVDLAHRRGRGARAHRAERQRQVDAAPASRRVAAPDRGAGDGRWTRHHDDAGRGARTDRRARRRRARPPDLRRTILAEAAFGPRQLGRSSADAEQAARLALDEAGLSDAVDMHPGELGAARRKLLVIASTVAMGTPVVALDEPTAGLDARGRDRARSIIGRLRDGGSDRHPRGPRPEVHQCGRRSRRRPGAWTHRPDGDPVAAPVDSHGPHDAPASPPRGHLTSRSDNADDALWSRGGRDAPARAR